MEKQQTFASAAWSRQNEVARREQFLAKIHAVIPWPRILKLIEPRYLGKTDRQPHNLEQMLRSVMQQWFNLSDPQAQDAIYDDEPMRRFARLEREGSITRGERITAGDTLVTPRAPSRNSQAGLFPQPIRDRNSAQSPDEPERPGYGDRRSADDSPARSLLKVRISETWLESIQTVELLGAESLPRTHRRDLGRGSELQRGWIQSEKARSVNSALIASE